MNGTVETPPKACEFELTLFGPGYGESIVMHIGGRKWVIVDSFLGSDEQPVAFRYLKEIGVDPQQSVVLILATHWHDDHIRGISNLVELCPSATFCCAGALAQKEFLTLVGALEGRHLSASGSGTRELYGVFSHLKSTKRNPTYAIANRVIYREGFCTISSLSPSDDIFQSFLKSIECLIPGSGENKLRVRSLSPNNVAVVLWVEVGQFSLLLGADLERSGWVGILNDNTRSTARASVYKVAHHGSANADEPEIWNQMLESAPHAILAPWCRGRHYLPTKQDIKRIYAATNNAYLSSANTLTPHTKRGYVNQAVSRTIRESGARFRPLSSQVSSVRLRRTIGSNTPWSVELFGDACHLNDLSV